MANDQVQVQTFNWGPCVIKVKIRDDFRKLLLDEGNKCTRDMTDSLAGILHKEVGYDKKAMDLILPTLSKYIGVYDQAYQRFTNKVYDKPPEYVLSSLWINYQRQHDYNPPHDHDGKLSFVIYLQIPDKLKEENKKYIGRSCGPGGIQFVWGEGPRDCVSYQTFFPEEGDMFVVPAWLKHHVAPYRAKCTRISVSGNFHDSAPLNNLKQFAPKYINAKKFNT